MKLLTLVCPLLLLTACTTTDEVKYRQVIVTPPSMSKPNYIGNRNTIDVTTPTLRY